MTDSVKNGQKSNLQGQMVSKSFSNKRNKEFGIKSELTKKKIKIRRIIK